MELIYQIIIAAVIIGVLAGLMHYGKKQVCLPVYTDDNAQIEIRVYCRGDGKNLQQTVKGLEWFVENKTIPGKILLVDEGLSDEGQKTAEILCRDSRVVSLISAALENCCKEELRAEETWGNDTWRS